MTWKGLVFPKQDLQLSLSGSDPGYKEQYLGLESNLDGAERVQEVRVVTRERRKPTGWVPAADQKVDDLKAEIHFIWFLLSRLSYSASSGSQVEHTRTRFYKSTFRVSDVELCYAKKSNGRFPDNNFGKEDFQHFFPEYFFVNFSAQIY